MPGGAHVYDAMRRYKEARRSSASRNAGRPVGQRREPERPASSETPLFASHASHETVAAESPGEPGKPDGPGELGPQDPAVATKCSDDATPVARRGSRSAPELRALAGRPGSMRAQVALAASIGVNISFILLIGMVWSSAWLGSHDRQPLLTSAKTVLKRLAPWHERAPGSAIARPPLAQSAATQVKPPAPPPAAPQPIPTAVSSPTHLAAAEQGAGTAPPPVTSIREALRRYRDEHKIGPSPVTSMPPDSMPKAKPQQSPAPEATQPSLPMTPAVAAQPAARALPQIIQVSQAAQTPAVIEPLPAAAAPVQRPPVPAEPAADTPVRAVVLAEPPDQRRTASTSGRGRVVIARAGDSLSSIIIERYGRYDGDILSAVLRRNPQIRSPDWIMVGEVIRLPR